MAVCGRGRVGGGHLHMPMVDKGVTETKKLEQYSPSTDKGRGRGDHTRGIKRKEGLYMVT